MSLLCVCVLAVRHRKERGQLAGCVRIHPKQNEECCCVNKAMGADAQQMQDGAPTQTSGSAATNKWTHITRQCASTAQQNQSPWCCGGATAAAYDSRQCNTAAPQTTRERGREDHMCGGLCCVISGGRAEGGRAAQWVPPRAPPCSLLCAAVLWGGRTAPPPIKGSICTMDGRTCAARHVCFCVGGVCVCVCPKTTKKAPVSVCGATAG